MNVLVLDFRVKSKQASVASSRDNKINNIVDFNSFITIQRENLVRFRDAIAGVKSDLVNCLTQQCTEYICNTTKKAPSSLTHEKYNSIKMNNADFYEKMIEVAQASGSVVQQSKEYIYATSKRKTTSLDQYSAQLQQSLSAIGQFIEDPNNVPVHAASVYDVAYTKELLDDSELLAAEEPPPYIRGSKVAQGVISEQHHVSYTTRAAIRLVCRRILSVFRIVDYMMRDLLYELLKQELSALQALLKQAHRLYVENHRALIAQHQQLQHPGVPADGDIAVYQYSTHSGASGTKSAASPANKKKGVDSSSSIVNIPQILGSLHFSLAISITEYNYQTLTESQIESASLFVIPTVDVCVEAFAHILREICFACQYSEGLLFNGQCLSVLRPISNEFSANPLPDRIFQNDMDGGSSGGGQNGGGGGAGNTNEIQTMSKQCLYYFQQSFLTLNKYTQYLNGFKKQYAKNLSLLLKTEKYKLLESNTEDILRDLEMFDEQANAMNQLTDYFQLGIIFVNILPMKKILSSILTYNLNTYNKYIPRLYLHYSDIFFKEIAGLMDKLNTKYNNIDEYIKNVEVYNVILGKQDAMSEQFGVLNRLKEIMEIRSIKITDEISKQNLLLTTIYTKLNLLTSDFHEELENQVKIYRMELSNRLKSILIPIQDLQAYFTTINAMLCNRDLSGELDDDESPNFIDSESILTMLFDYKQQIVKISKQLGVLDYYQSLLNTFVFEHNLQLEIQSELHAYILLFQHFQSVLSLNRQTLISHYIDISAMALGKEISVYKQELVDCDFFNALLDQNSTASSGTILGEASQQLPQSNVDVQNNQGILRLYNKVLLIISTLESYIPILTVLQSKALTMDHQSKINRLLGVSLFDLNSTGTIPAVSSLSLSITVDHGGNGGLEYTLGTLIGTHHILEHREALHDIFEEAVVLFNIDNKLLSTIRQINLLEFDFHYESDNKSLLYISNYRLLIDDLYDHLLSVQSISQSTAFGLIASKYGGMLANYQDYVLYLKYLQNIQLAYSKYKVLFISARSARYLSVHMRNYKYLDDTYRLLIKAAKTSKLLYLFLNDRQNRSYIMSCMENVNIIEQGFQNILQDFCEKSPKLYLVCPNVLYQTFLISSLKDLTLLCIPYILNYMNVTNVEFDISDDNSIVSIVCAEEKVMFTKPCSGRSSIHDYFKTLESSIHERFEKDIRELCMLYIDERKNIALLEEIKHSKYSTQALVLVYQIQFWSHFWSMLTSSSVGNTLESHVTSNSAKPVAVYNRSTQSKLKQFIIELQEQISILYTVYTDTVQAYTIKFTSAMVMLICYYRDILRNILDEYNVCWDSETNISKTIHEVMQSLSSVYCSMQKFVVNHPYNTNTFNIQYGSQVQSELLQNVNNINFNVAQNIYVLMGGEKVKYGLKYQGFHDRLTITPLVDKFYYHLYQSFSSQSVSNVSSGSSDSHQQDTKLLRSFGYDLGIEHFVFDVNDWLLNSNNPNLHNMLPMKQSTSMNGLFSISDISQEEVDILQRQDPLIRFSKIMRAALKLGLWVIIRQNHDVAAAAAANYSSDRSNLLSHIFSTLSVVYEEVYNKVTLAPLVPHAKVQKFELFRNMPASVTVDYAYVCNMKWTLLNCFPASGMMMQKQEYQLLSRSFRPVQTPQVSFKVVLALLLSSFNFVQVLRLSERLDALVTFLCSNTALLRDLAEYLLLKSISTIGVNNDHILINVALQLKVLVKTYLNNLPSQIFAAIWHKELLPVIYNLHLEMLFDAEKEAKEFRHAIDVVEQVKNGMLNTKSAFLLLYDSKEEKSGERSNQADSFVELVVEALWDFNYPPQLNRSLVNDHILDMDMSAILPVAGLATSQPNSQQATGSQHSVNYQQLAHQLYKNSVIVVGNVGAGKTNIICRSLMMLRERHFVEEKLNVRIYPYIINQPVMPGINAVQEKIQLFLNGDRHNALSIMCFDDHDCLQLHQLVRYIHIYHRQQRVKCIGEVLHLGDIDPSIIVSHRIIAVSYLYSVDQLFARHLRQCWEGESLIFRRVLTEFTDEIVKPVFHHFSNQSHDPQALALDVIPQLYACISSLFHAYCFPHSAYSEVYNTTPASPRVGGIAALHAKYGSNPQVSASESNSHSDANKPYKTPNTLFDEDSLRRIVLYSLLQTLGRISTYRYKSVVLHDIGRYHNAIEEFLQRAFVENREVSSVTKRAFPRQNNLMFSQYLTPRLQSAGSSVSNQNLKSGTKSSASSLMVLEWTVIDQKHILALQQLQNASSADSFNRHALVSSNSPLNFPIHTYHTLVAPTQLSVHLTYLQSGYTHILPVFNQYMNSRNSTNSILFHDANFSHNLFSSRGLLLMGDPGSGRSVLLRQMLSHQALSKFNKHWIIYYQNNAADSNASCLGDFVLGGQLRLQKQRYEHNIPNVGALFIDDLHLDSDVRKCKEVSRGITQYNTIYDSKGLQFKLVHGFYLVATSAGAYSWNRYTQEKIVALNSDITAADKSLDKNGAHSEGKIGKGNQIDLHLDARYERIARHFHKISLAPSMILTALASYLDNKLGLFAPDFCHDLVSLVYYSRWFLQHIGAFAQLQSRTEQGSLQDATSFVIETSSICNQLVTELSFPSNKAASLKMIHGMLVEKYPSYNANTFDLCSVIDMESSSASTKKILDGLILGVIALNPVHGSTDNVDRIGLSTVPTVLASINDVINVYDRICTEDLVRYIHSAFFFDVYNMVVDHATNHVVPFRSGSLAALLEKLRLSRAACYENISGNDSEGLSLFEPISYTRNIYGFYKTSNTSTPNLLTAEALRDTISKHFQSRGIEDLKVLLEVDHCAFLQLLTSFAMLPSIVDSDDLPSMSTIQHVAWEYAKLERHNLSFWHDILQIVTFWTHSEQSSSKSSSLLYLNCPTDMYNINYLAESFLSNNLPILYSGSFASRVIRVLVSIQFYDRVKVLSVKLSSDSQSINGHDGLFIGDETPFNLLLRQFGWERLRNALTAILLFLLDTSVRSGLCSFVRLHAISFETIFNRDTGIFYVPVFITDQLAALMEKVVRVYALDQSESKNKSAGEQTVWLIQSSNLSANTAAMLHFMEDMTLQGTLISRLFQLVHPKLDLLQYIHILSPCRQDYLLRQRLVVLNDSSLPLPKSFLEKAATLYEGNVCSYALHSDYFSNQVLEKLLLSYLQQTTRLALIDTVCDEKLLLRKAMEIVNGMIDLLYAQISLTSSRSSLANDYIRGELVSLCLNTLRSFVLRGCRLDEFPKYKQKVRKFLERSTTSQQLFIANYISTLQPIDFLLISVLRTFYYQCIPDTFVKKDDRCPTSILTAFISQQFPISQSVVSSIEVQQQESSTIYNTMLLVSSCLAANDQLLCRGVHCIPEARLAKGFLLSIMASYSMSGVVLIHDDLLSLLLLNGVLGISTVPTDIVCLIDGFKVSVNATKRCLWSSEDSHTYRVTLSHNEYMHDFFIVYLLERGLLGNVCASLQGLYKRVKESALHTLDEGEFVEGLGGKHMTKYNSLYDEAILALAPIVDTLILVFRQFCRILQRRDHAVQVEVAYALLDGLENCLKTFDILAMQRGDDQGMKLSLRELIGVSVFAFMTYIIPTLVNDEEFTLIMLDTFLDFYLLPYSFTQQTIQPAEAPTISNSSLSEYRDQLLTLLGAYLSPHCVAGGYKADSKYGIIVPNNAIRGDHNQTSKKKRKKTVQYINGGLSSLDADDDNASLDSADRSREDGDSRPSSASDHSSARSDESQNDGEEEVYMLAPEAKHVFRQCLVILSQVIPAIDNTFSAKYIEISRSGSIHDNLRILDGIHDEIDLFVDFAASICTTIKSVPEAEGYHLNVLEKLFLSIFCKVDAAVTLCKDLIGSCGLFLNLEDKRLQDIIYEWQLRRCSTPASNVLTISVTDNAVTDNTNLCVGSPDGFSQVISSSYSSPVVAALEKARLAAAQLGGASSSEGTDCADVGVKRGMSQSLRSSITGARLGSMRMLDSDSVKKKTLTLYFIADRNGLPGLISFMEHYSKQYTFSVYESIFIVIFGSLQVDVSLVQQRLRGLGFSNQMFICHKSVVIDSSQPRLPYDIACHTLGLSHMHSRDAILSKLNFCIRYTASLPYVIDASVQSLLVPDTALNNSYINKLFDSAVFVDLFIKKVKMMVDRCRWLVIFFHIAVCYYEESIRYNDSTHRRSISISTLAHATFSIERAIINVLSQSIHSYMVSQNVNSSVSADEASDEIIKLSYAHFDEVHLHHIILLLIYYPLLRSSGLGSVSTVDDLYVKYIFENIFTTRSCRYDCTYAILDSLPLPNCLDLEREDAGSFFRDLVSIVNEPSGENDRLFQLFFVSKPEYSHKVWSVLNKGIFAYGMHCRTFLVQKPGSATGAFTFYRRQLPSTDILLRHMASLLSRLLLSLPDTIDLCVETDLDECFHNVLSHFKADKDMESVQGRKTMVVRPQEMSKNMYKGGGKLRRKLGHGKLLNFNARDYDPLLMHMLSEVDAFNTHLTVTRKAILMMIAACNNRDHFEFLLSKGLCSDASSVASQLLSHTVPPALCSQGSAAAFGGLMSFNGYALFWKKRYDLLSRFTRTGQLDDVQLFLLSNVSGLMYAMKESYSVKTESSVDKIHIHYDMMSCAQYQDFLQSNYHKLDSQENMGCNIRATNVALFNCRLVGRGTNCSVYNSGTNSSSLSLDLLPVTSQTSFGTV